MNAAGRDPTMLASFDPISGKAGEFGGRDAPLGQVFAKRARAAAIDCFYYLPRRRDPARVPLICVHGISRNALEHVFAFRRHADDYGFALVAPVFDSRAYRGYQTLGSKNGWNALRAFAALLDEAAETTGGQAQTANLFGFSGGGQFVHRFAMARPGRVNAFAIASAGWYTLPTEIARYPLGVSGPSSPDVDISAFLKLPMLVMVGSADRDRDATLRQGRKIDAQQGADRVERAKRWAAAVNDAAHFRGLPPPAAYAELPGATHSFADCVRSGLVSRAAEFLLQQPSCAPSAKSGVKND